jgi:hypothetical protein
MESLNEFELAILEKLSSDYPGIKSHIPYLRIASRKLTGVGMYIDFVYEESPEILDPIPHAYLSTRDFLKMEGLRDGLINDITLTNGRIDTIELVTYDEPWDGIIRKFFWDEKF